MTAFTTTPWSPVSAGRVSRSGRRAAGRAPADPRLGPSPFGHRSLAEDLMGVAEERAARTSRTPRPGAGTRVGTDSRTVLSPRAFISPRVMTSPRTFAEPRGTTAIRAVRR